MDLIDSYFSVYSESERQTIRLAYEAAAKALEGRIRENGHPFLEHPVGVARIVTDEIGLPAECVAAVFLHEASRAGMDPLPKGFDDSVYGMVDSLNKLSTINPKDTRLEAERYKKLIIQYSQDPRVTVIKLADRLEVMRSLSFFPKPVRERKVLETLMLYIPLAHQLGLYNMKREMEDIYLLEAEPEQYRLITNKLKATQKDRERLMSEFIGPLQRKLSDEGIRYKLKIRTKAAYSIWAKMMKQNVPFEGVYDVFAIRFIIDCPEDDPKLEKDLCWRVYSFVTEEYEADTSRLRDWVTNPKPNGYESLHITVKNRRGAYVEVQIRTRRMDDIAENGFASHWSYKGIKREESLDRWLNAVRFALEHPGEEGVEDLPQPPSREIFVFTPTGELRILPAGASVLDFAFSIHSNLGCKCTGAKVGGKVVSIKEKLATGDVVEILSAKNQHPAPGWLDCVVTTKARQKIRQALHEGEMKKASAGRELLERRLRNWKLEFPDEMQTELMKKLHYTSVSTFMGDIADGVVDVNQIKEYILTEDQRRQEAISAAAAAEAARVRTLPEGSHEDIFILNARDSKGLDYRMSRCCNPVFGDDVFGFVTRTGGLKIHRITCPNAARLMDTYPYRIQKVRWASTPSGGSFQVALKIVTEAESVVLNKVMEVVSAFKASIRSFNVVENPRGGTYDIAVRLSVSSNLELDKVLSQIRALKQVQKVVRQ